MNLAYVAGIIDGEGCIQFSRCRASVFPRVLVVNTNLTLLEGLKDQFGGDIKPVVHRKPAWKPAWMWRLSWSRAVDLLDRISPWLLIKQDQAATVFAWDAVRPDKGSKSDPESLDLLRRRMAWLNAKGSADIGPDPIDEFL